ncbi:MAG: type II toxin-antitoxin system VapC family toxin [Deltaproteobacteria bacterium]|nr:type II toxin-antitoxin system VapC family toxin [Deltaproteobacteria bacterium]
MTIRIIDASVAIKWFVKQEEGADRALCLLDEIRVSVDAFAVPELFFDEMLHVLCKILPTEALVQSYMEALQDLGLHRLGNGRQTIATAIRLAKRHHLSGYDAVYAANAQLVQGVWITADAEAHGKIAPLKISCLL